MNVLVTTSGFQYPLTSDTFEFIQNPYKRRLTEKELLELVEAHQPVGIIAGVEPITRTVLEKAKNLRVISRCGVGMDAIDLPAAEELGIQVLITPNAPIASVAELSIALMLSLLRKIPQCDKTVKNGGWKGAGGNLLKGKTVGIIGCGRIGTYVAQILKCFGCSLIGYDIEKKEHEAIQMVGFETLLTQSDIISLHLPYSKANHHMIGPKELAMMKQSALLLNTARGGLVDEDALYTALDSGGIAGAALDCYEEEPYSGKLCTLENILLTPHIGSSAAEGRLRMEQEALENLLGALRAEEKP